MVVLASTSAGLLLPLLKDAGEQHSTFGQLVMTAAALAEVGSVMLLSLLFSATSTTVADRVSSLVIFLALLAVVGLALGRVRNLAAIDRLLDRLEDRSGQLRVRAALTLALGFGVLANRFGLASILGAFAAGLLVKTIDLTGRAPHPQFQIKLEGIGFGFLVPVFFISTGIQFDAQSPAVQPRRPGGGPLVPGRPARGPRHPSVPVRPADRHAPGGRGRPHAGDHPHLRHRGHPARCRHRATQPHRLSVATGRRTALRRHLPRPRRQAAPHPSTLSPGAGARVRCLEYSVVLPMCYEPAHRRWWPVSSASSAPRALEAHQARRLHTAIGSYTSDASVTDEGSTYTGADEIRAWLARSGSEYS